MPVLRTIRKAGPKSEVRFGGVSPRLTSRSMLAKLRALADTTSALQIGAERPDHVPIEALDDLLHHLQFRSYPSAHENNSMPTELLGGAAPQRDLHFIFLADCSGSMTGAKISALNAAIESAIGPMRQTVANQPNVRVLVRAIRFSDQASWHVAQETPLENFQWHELQAGGRTSTGAAIRLALDALSKLKGRQYPPVLVLVSDGQATDDARSAIGEISANNWGQRAVRRAVAIGDDADIESLKSFIGEPEIEPIVAHRPEDIAAALCFVSVGSLSSASIGKEFGGPAPSSPSVLIPGVQSSGTSTTPSGNVPQVDPSMPKDVF